MAGKRQHYIPRFLQQGFSSHSVGDASFTWVYRKGSRAFNTNIVNVGTEGFFYTEGDDALADDKITKAEDRFAVLVKSLREHSPGSISGPELPELISHLEIRTRHFRQSLLRAGDVLAARLLDFVADERAFIPYLEKQFITNPSVLRDAMTKAIASRGLPAMASGPLSQLLSASLPQVLDQLRPMLPLFAQEARREITEKLKEGAKSGHIRGLKEAVAPERRTQRYASLEYTIVPTEGQRLILGDAAVLFHVDGPRSYKTLIDAKDRLLMVILPLSSSRALIGAPHAVASLPAAGQEAAARCSFEYFIAAEKSTENEALQASIGHDCDVLTREEIEAIVADLIKV